VSAAALVERQLSVRDLHGDRELDAAGARRRRDSRSGGGRLTLEQLLDSVWEGLHADGAAECPVCRGRIARTPAGGACADCGSSLA
jgi:hypothetical protein